MVDGINGWSNTMRIKKGYSYTGGGWVDDYEDYLSHRVIRAQNQKQRYWDRWACNNGGDTRFSFRKMQKVKTFRGIMFDMYLEWRDIYNKENIREMEWHNEIYYEDINDSNEKSRKIAKRLDMVLGSGE